MLYANDLFSDSEKQTFKIIVKPTNDLPIIKQIGDQVIYQTDQQLIFVTNQGDNLKLKILVDDVDGDVINGRISYNLNITDKENLYLQNNELIFEPKNDDVGFNYFTISITDNNDTYIDYISQCITIWVKNINDQPTVKIDSPLNDQEFYINEHFSLICTAEDIDFLIPESQEKLNYRWFANKTELGDLGNERTLRNISFSQPGIYIITIEVTDVTGAKNFSSINIKINDFNIPNNGSESNDTNGRDNISEPDKSEMNWLILSTAILIIIIIILVSLFLLFKYKKIKRDNRNYP
jgi:hypothetical protein